MIDGKISIGRTSGGGEEGEANPIRISLQDANSRVHFLTLRMSMEDFTRAIMSEANIPCRFDLLNREVVGMCREDKNILVDFTFVGYDRELMRAALAHACESFEVDGWLANASHPLTTQNGYAHIKGTDLIRANVPFHRYYQLTEA